MSGYVPMEPRPTPQPSPADVERFWALVAKAGAEDCWEWQGGLAPNGYGLFGYERNKYVASRVSWRIAHGEPGQIYVLHKCDNRRCVNPDHLFLGSFQDNMDDRNEKGRTAKGEEHGMVRLAEEQARQILAAHYEIGLRVCDLAILFGERRQFVSRIIRGDRWAHLRAGDPRDRRHSVTDQTVLSMRAARWRLGLSTRDVAKMFGQPLGSTQKLVSGVTRGHLGGIPRTEACAQ